MFDGRLSESGITFNITLATTGYFDILDPTNNRLY
jgi:hypothetical protein